MAAKVSNWGRWGSDDEAGALNFVTAEKLVEAAKLVKRGKAIALGMGSCSHRIALHSRSLTLEYVFFGAPTVAFALFMFRRHFL
jgi:hypothetical protein